MQSAKALQPRAPTEVPYARDPVKNGSGVVRAQKRDTKHALLAAHETPFRAVAVKYNPLHKGIGEAIPFIQLLAQFAPVKATPRPDVDTLNSVLLNK
jgi:hypothetical protein